MNRTFIVAAALISSSLCVALPQSWAQEKPPAAPATPPAPSLKPGDKAPPLEVESFVKGDAVKEFKPGSVYVVEFWATWCGPCVAAMPHLSEMQKEYKAKNVTFIGVNIWEDREYNEATPKKVQEFVTKKGEGMAYTVAYDGPAKKSDTAWMQAAGRRGIPSTFVVDQKGNVAWIGHPAELDIVVDEVVKGTWDVTEGPKKLKAMQDAVAAALEKYKESYEAGDAAWNDAIKAHASLANHWGNQRYAAMVSAGYGEKAAPIGRDMLKRAKADKDIGGLMGVVVPLLDPQTRPKTFDRDLVKQVAEAVKEVSEPTDVGAQVCLVQIYMLLGDSEQAQKYRAKALELVPAEQKAGLERWLKQMEEDAPKK